MEINCGSEKFSLVIIIHSDKSCYIDKFEFFKISIFVLCVSMSPSKAVLPLCWNSFTLRDNLQDSATVNSIDINDDCCSELQPSSRKEWQKYRVCTIIKKTESTEEETGRKYYQCVEKRKLPIELHYEVSIIFSGKHIIINRISFVRCGFIYISH